MRCVRACDVCGVRACVRACVLPHVSATGVVELSQHSPSYTTAECSARVLLPLHFFD